MRAIWTGLALNRHLTGIERLMTSLARDFFRRYPDGRLQVWLDADVEWASAFPEQSEIRLISRQPFMRSLWSPLAVEERGFDVVHTFSNVLAKRRETNRRGGRVHTVMDWGPMLDPRFPSRARAPWAYAILTGSTSADGIHYLSSDAIARTPRYLRRMLRAKPAAVASPNVQVQMTKSTDPRSFWLFVGTVSARKRLDLLQEACRYDDAISVMAVGAGTDRLNRTANFVGLGAVTEEHLEQLYERCRGVVLVSDYEGLGLPVLEAVARGLPAVVSEAVAAAQPKEVRQRLVRLPRQSGRELATLLARPPLHAYGEAHLALSEPLWRLYERLYR